ncbi:TPA: hypothetical protein ACXR0I_002947 [Klebsiella variicola subsp. variicola]|nr:hypothetical protein [Klebsiella variicola]EIX9042398.1 hypothetical protein [Klebsiella variicola]EIY5153316.1 hypothetical protein [Klebsiella variicola]MCB8424674.1 hypothetical protein [Klebsiella variicola subsp. variicola]MCB8445268.1 hypothetical protein [Klebsiella variicola subsp. variicola]VAN72856.1 Uncharacterised protein [Klebsiella variicola]
MTRLKTVCNDDCVFDSARVDIFVTLVHQIGINGLYNCDITNETGGLYHFKLTVGDVIQKGQVVIDCDQFHSNNSSSIKDVSMNSKDYIMFVSMRGEGRYEVNISNAANPHLVVFNSNSIGANSMISITPYMPGDYEVSEQYSGVNCKLEVRSLESLFENAMSDDAVYYYQKIREEGALNVVVNKEGFLPNPLRLDADRPMVIQGVGPMRIIGRKLNTHS